MLVEILSCNVYKKPSTKDLAQKIYSTILGLISKEYVTLIFDKISSNRALKIGLKKRQQICVR
jgi:hypothetical protein